MPQIDEPARAPSTSWINESFAEGPAAVSARPLALITGASSGIGAAFARRLARDGHDLVLVARRLELLEALAEELLDHGTDCRLVRADLSTPAGLERVEAVMDGLRPLRVLVNCAGFGTRGQFAEVDPGVVDAMVQLHVRAPVRLTRAVIPAMIQAGQGGAVINVSSLGAFVTGPQYVTYSATKACLNTFSEGLAQELRPHGIRVQALCPGLTHTGFFHTPQHADFAYEQVPELAWMSAEAVVDASIEALESGPVIVVPGLLNRAFIAALRAPLLGRALRRVLAVLAAVTR